MPRPGFLAAALLAALAIDPGVAEAQAEKRVALVIGNSAYKEGGALKNPVNDARIMAAALRELGFQVVARENATKQQMERAVGEFGDALAAGAVGLFYYAGHGLQVNGRNYLVPVDANIGAESRVRLETLDADLVIEQMASVGSSVNLVLLDACRNNPFERRFRSGGAGLAQINAPKGTLIAYSTAPGTVAADGDGANSIYTAKLVQAIKTPGLAIEEVFKRVRIEVSRDSNDLQTPWEASSLVGNFYFLGPTTVIVNPPASAAAPAPAAPPPAAPAQPKQAAAPVPATTGRFDGNWLVTVVCPPDPGGAKGYEINLPGTVKEGALHAQASRQEHSLTITGAIQPDGTATLYADGIIGNEAYAANRGARGTAYKYTIAARFDGARGSGNRVQSRICNLTFAKQ